MLLKTKSNGKIDALLEYGHSQINVVFFDDMEFSGFDTVAYKWFKPRCVVLMLYQHSVWIDELRLDVDLKNVTATWVLPGESKYDKGKKTKELADDVCIYVTVFIYR